MSAKSIPDGYDALIPAMIVRDAAKAIAFYKELFGATELMRMNYPDGQKVAHAELKIRNHVMMLGDENPALNVFAPKPSAAMPPSCVMLYVTNVDETFNKAIKMGATAMMPPMDMFWGDRYCKFVDPFGHAWAVATHTRDVPPDELAKASAAWAKEKQPRS